MKRRLLAAASTLALAAAMLTAAATPAEAHGANWHFTGSKWNYNTSISYGLNAGFPTGAWRSVVYDGKTQWHSTAGTAEPKIYWWLADDVSYGVYDNPCTLSSGNNTAVVFWQNLDSVGTGVLGYTRACSNNGVRTRITIAFDAAGTDWYAGTGDAGPSQSDAWSVSTHEWGHGVGWQVHLDGADPNVCQIWENTYRHSMCPSTFPGMETQRWAKTHDTHTRDAAY